VNRVDLHPEQLFDHLRDGSITPDEYELLQAHCGICTPCRLELRLVFEPMGAPLPDFDDRLLGMAVVDRMLRSPPRSAQPAAPPAAPVEHESPVMYASAPAANDSADSSNDSSDRRVRARVSAFQRGRSAAFIAAGIVLGCSMTAAALVPEFSTGIVSVVTSAVTSMVGLASPAKSRVHGRSTTRPELARALPLPSSATDETVVAEALVEPRRVEPRTDASLDGSVAVAPSARSAVVEREDRAALSADSRRGARARSGKPAIEGADMLLAAAARARARGAYAEAADYYRMLQRHYPNTEAEIVARVSLGRLLCLRLAQPQVALELFDEYLSQRPNGALGQEARNGRAQCLERLGRLDEARSAWQDLVEHHPNSVYADEARVRLARQ
jgi:hypothetical protein